VTPEPRKRTRTFNKAQALATGSRKQVVEKIARKMKKFLPKKTASTNKHYIKDESGTIGEMIAQASSAGRKYFDRRFVRFKVGESAAAQRARNAPVRLA